MSELAMRIELYSVPGQTRLSGPGMWHEETPFARAARLKSPKKTGLCADSNIPEMIDQIAGRASAQLLGLAFEQGE